MSQVEGKIYRYNLTIRDWDKWNHTDRHKIYNGVAYIDKLIAEHRDRDLGRLIFNKVHEDWPERSWEKLSNGMRDAYNEAALAVLEANKEQRHE